jgi:hypothetical protein
MLFQNRGEKEKIESMMGEGDGESGSLNFSGVFS